MELTPSQILLVGLIASALAAGLRLLVAKWGNKVIGKGWMTAIVAAISFGLAIAFSVPTLPVYIDPLQYIGELAVLLSAYLGAATAIYNLILDKLLDVIGLKVERLASG